MQKLTKFCPDHALQIIVTKVKNLKKFKCKNFLGNLSIKAVVIKGKSRDDSTLPETQISVPIMQERIVVIFFCGVVPVFAADIVEATTAVADGDVRRVNLGKDVVDVRTDDKEPATFVSTGEPVRTGLPTGTASGEVEYREGVSLVELGGSYFIIWIQRQRINIRQINQRLMLGAVLILKNFLSRYFHQLGLELAVPTTPMCLHQSSTENVASASKTEPAIAPTRRCPNVVLGRRTFQRHLQHNPR
mmetsp:Transcript_3555/g.7837  ORF Transcript_3555/g.7837 Transcript_3555/m.7837 type:complete len:246 (+) Transcript_3555:1496-2233(+)